MSERSRSRLIARAWRDEEFHKKLVSDPRGAMEDLGIKIPDDVEIQVHEETERTLHLVIPRRPEKLPEPSLEEMVLGFYTWEYGPCPPTVFVCNR